MKRGLLLVALVAVVIWWDTWIRPAGQGAIVLLDIYSSALYGSNYAAYATPAPREFATRETLARVETRVSWWTPGWGDAHPAVMLVNGATEAGNDDPETRRLSEAIARAGYLVMLPEFPFLKEGRLDRDAPLEIDDAFAAMRARPEVDGRRAGAFGFSVGGGMLLAAAGRGGALRDASFIAALGAYYDLDTYLASVVSGSTRGPAGVEPWTPDETVRLRLPLAATETIGDAADRAVLGDALRQRRLAGDPPAGIGSEAAALWRALAATDYEVALGRLHDLPRSIGGTFDELSPRAVWGHIAAPIFWLHDEGDRFEPVSEARTAAAAPRPGVTRLVTTRLISHAAALGEDARSQGPLFWTSELRNLLSFAIEVLRAAG